MMLSLLFLSFLILLAPTTSAQEWQQEYPVPSHLEINDFHFPSPSFGWMVGEEGLLMVTANSGKNWAFQNSTSLENLNGLAFINEDIGWIVGNNATILKTTDSGNSWLPQIAPNQANLIKVQFFDANIGWALTSANDIIRTTDGGQNWVSHNIGSSILSDFEFIDATIGWAIGGTSAWKTTDGGQNWVQQSLGATLPLTAIDFIDANRGWIVGYTGTSYKTTDGGATWAAINVPMANNYNLDDVHFMDSLNGITMRSHILLGTTDGGQNWNFLAGGNYKKVFFHDANLGWAIGSFNSLNTFSSTTDAGVSWTDLFSKNGYPLQDVHAINNNEIWAVGQGGNYASSDGGKTWLNKRANLSPCYEVHFADNGSDGWMITTWLRIYRTSDAGNNWTISPSLGNGIITESLHELDFVDNLNGWVGSSYGTIYRTIDGGLNWTAASTPFPSQTRVIKFASPQIGWCGNSSTVYKSTDAGTSWQIDSTFNGASIADIDFVDSLKGWAVGTQNSQGVVFRTTDGGANWVSVIVPFSFAFVNVNFADNQFGWLCDYNGDIWQSNNGGQLWTYQHYTSNGKITDVTAIDSAHCWAVGEQSIILRYQDCSFGIPSITENSGSLSTGNFQNYQWYFNDTLISGATQQNYTPTSAGVYTVEISAPDDCYATSYGFVISPLSILSIETIPNKGSQLFEVFPNPSTGLFHLRFDPSFIPKRVLVFDLTGKIVQEISSQNLQPTLQLNLHDLPNGLYLIQAQNSTSNQTQKIRLLHP